MARDAGLGALVSHELRAVQGITEKAMFGGWAWLLRGYPVCGARDDGMLARLGPGRDAWALQIAGIEPMISRGRRMRGWVRASADAYADDATREELVATALAFVETLAER